MSPLPTELLAKHYIGELANVARIRNRAANSQRNIDACITAITNAGTDASDSYLAALARELKRQTAKHERDTERVRAQNVRFRQIAVQYSHLETSEQRQFHAVCNEIGDAPVPMHYLSLSDDEWRMNMARSR